MQIDLISFKKKRVRIEYRIETEGGSPDVIYDSINTQKSSMPPTLAFENALEAFSDLSFKFVPIDNQKIKSLIAHTVQLKSEKENLSMVIGVTIKTTLTKAPFDFNTPKVSELDESWDEEVIAAVIEIMAQAEKYINGEYAQMELELEVPTEMTIVGNEQEEEAVAA